ncbi:hypothetical protein HY487_01060 [Candidatus Woesearchaeota archaeon]|nr:hypothetical protein [Candidatus Woesearchaeota archaeon]
MQAKKIDSRFIERVELELLSALFKYAVPFLSGKIDAKVPKGQKSGSLESIVNNRQPKMGIKDFKELESLLVKNLGQNAKASKKAAINSRDIFYSISLRRQKNKNEKAGKYSVAIQYEENSGHEKLSVKIKKDGREIYSAESGSQKEMKDRVAPYGISISYEDNYGEERLTITYRQQLKNYMKKHIENKEDMTNMVPLKWLNILPESMMGGILGFTYLGENFMGRRADLTGKTARMVDIHESIHTPDEYETRRLTDWIMSKERSKYIK